MKNRFITLAVALVVVLSVTLSAAPAPERDPFKGKVLLVIYNEGNTIMRVAVEQARVQKLGERHYIVGKAVDSRIRGLMMMGDCTLWIPENSVTSIAEYDSVEKIPSVQDQRGSPHPQNQGPLPIGDPRRKQEKGRPSAIPDEKK